jgi:1,2-diacylglycerol 3-alpha-glucosyltransferase
MRLLICASEYYPYGSGIANVAYNVVEQLRKMGVECTVCSPTGPDIKLGSDTLIQKYGIVGLIYYWYQVSKYFKNKRDCFDILWYHNPLFIKNNPFDRFLVTIHSTYHGQYLHREVFPLHIQIYKKLASIVQEYCFIHLKLDVLFTGVSTSVCSEIEKIGINREKIIYIPNGVDIELFKPSDKRQFLRKKFHLPPDKVILLSVGRLTQVKQPLKLIETYSIIEKEEKNVTLVIAGDGELLSDTKKLAKEKNLNSVFFLGKVDHIKEAPDLYACSDFYVMTSQYEGQPLTLLEAIASGLSCITSDIQNLRFVQTANCGIVVDFSDTEKAAFKILGHIRERNSEHMRNARTYAEENLDWKIIAKKYLREFEDLMVS